jgi:hypothetical protein
MNRSPRTDGRDNNGKRWYENGHPQRHSRVLFVCRHSASAYHVRADNGLAGFGDEPNKSPTSQINKDGSRRASVTVG